MFVDDLARCPPDKVVQMLEAVQLLVKTELFVMVMALDVRYATLCLEHQYKGILEESGFPSGLDYLEKIVQIPYRVPPIHPDSMERYLAGQFPTLKDVATLERLPTQASTKSEEHRGDVSSNHILPLVDDMVVPGSQQAPTDTPTSEAKSTDGETVPVSLEDTKKEQW